MSVLLHDVEEDRETPRADVELAPVDDARQLEEHREPAPHPHVVPPEAGGNYIKIGVPGKLILG